MYHINVTLDPSPPAYLSIPFNVESALPGRSLSVTELLQHKFPSPFWAPCGSSSAGASEEAFVQHTRAPIRSSIHQSGRALVVRGSSQPSAHLGVIFVGSPVAGMFNNAMYKKIYFSWLNLGNLMT